MKWLAVIFVVVLALLVAAPIGGAIEEHTSYQQQQHALDLAARQYQQEQQRQWDQATAAGRVAGDYSWRIFALVAAGLALAGGVDAYGRRQARADADRRLVHADERGLLPVPRDALLAGEALDDRIVEIVALWHQTQTQRAIHQPGQAPASYAPQITVASPPSPLAATPPAAAPLALPGLTDLADVLGTFRPGLDRVLLGLGPGGAPLAVGVKQLCHVALIGATGGGKSNLLRLLLPQLQALGARIVLADPHFAPVDPESGEDWRPIAQRLHLPPAVLPATIAELLAWLTEELARRLALRRQGQHPGRPLFLAFDELPVIVESVPGAIDAISTILREGRKVNLLTVGASQDMLVKTIGGSGAVRDCYRTAFYVGGDVISASRLLDLPQRQIDDGQIQTGLALLRSTATTPAQLVRVPYASNAAIAALLGTSDPTSPATSDGAVDRWPGRGADVPPDAPPDVATSGQQDARNPRAERVRELLRRKVAMNDIIRQVWEVDPNGRAGVRARDEFRDILAQLVGGAA